MRGVVVEGVGDGLAQVHVRGLLAPGVELDAERGQRRLRRGHHPVHLRELVELVGAEAGHEIRLALDEGGALGGGFADELVDDAAELALVALPVVLDPLELVQGAVLDPPELVRSGAGLVVDEPLLAHVAVHLVGHDLLRVHDEPPGQERGEGCERAVEGEHDRVGVRRRDVLGLEERVQHPGRTLAERQSALERPPHRFRIHRVAVVELRVLHEVEGVGEPVVAHVPALGEPRHHPRRGVDVLQQRVVHRLLHGADRGVVLDARIHDRHRLTLRGDEDLLAVTALEGIGGVERRAGRRENCRRSHGDVESASHLISPCLRLVQSALPPVLAGRARTIRRRRLRLGIRRCPLRLRKAASAFLLAASAFGQTANFL